MACVIVAMDDVREQFGQIVRRLRKERALTQEELAFKAGMSVPYLSDLERGMWNPSLAMIVDLATALMVHPSDLLAELVVSPGAEPPRRRRPEE